VETFYAACAPDNVVSQYNGGYIYSLGWSFDDVSYGPEPQVNDAYECCVACITSDNCAFSMYDQFPNRCTTWTPADNVCNPSRQLSDFDVDGGVSGWSISNGGCGKFGLRVPEP
jgi:hypothetical protein